MSAQKELVRQIHITKESLGELPPAEAFYEVRDTRLQGFGVRVSPKGGISFILRWSLLGRDGRRTIGKYPALSVAAARRIAAEWLGRLAQGEDPRREQKVLREALSMKELLDKFEAEHVTHLKPGTQRDYKRVVKRLKAQFGTVLAKDLADADVARLHHELRATPREANKTVVILSKIMNLAERWGYRPKHTNPCYLQEKFPETQRIRALTDEEAATLGRILKAKESEAPKAVAVIRLMILTGARKGEIESLEWAWVDLEGQVIRIPKEHHKTGRATGRERVIALGPGAVAILQELSEKRLSKWVFPGNAPRDPKKKRPGPYVGTHCVWQGMRAEGAELAKAGLLDLHLHDLRHTFATWARRAGQDLDSVGDLLGHTDPRMARRYAHVVVDKLREDASAVEATLSAKLGG